MSSTNRIRAPRLTVPVRPRVLQRWLLLVGFGAMPAAAVIAEAVAR